MAETYGYIRVSSTDQNESRQCIAIKPAFSILPPSWTYF